MEEMLLLILQQMRLLPSFPIDFSEATADTEAMATSGGLIVATVPAETASRRNAGLYADSRRPIHMPTDMRLTSSGTKKQGIRETFQK